jgi:hypothetical protein
VTASRRIRHDGDSLMATVNLKYFFCLATQMQQRLGEFPNYLISYFYWVLADFIEVVSNQLSLALEPIIDDPIVIDANERSRLERSTNCNELIQVMNRRLKNDFGPIAGRVHTV